MKRVMSFSQRPVRDDAVPFASRWLRGEKRYLLAVAFPVISFPTLALPNGVKWDTWYDKPYFIVLASVVSQRQWMGWLWAGRQPAPQIECLAPVLSAEGKKGWYQFSQLNRGVDYRVQFFPQAKSSRSEIEFRWAGGALTAQTTGGAFPLESAPEAAFVFSRHYLVSKQKRSTVLRAFEHQNRMAWEVESLTVSGLASLIPAGLKLEGETPESSYFAKGSLFAEGAPQRY